MKTTILKSAMVLAVATLFTACGGDSGLDDDYNYVVPSGSSVNTDKITSEIYSYGSGFTINWNKSQDQYSEISYDYFANYERGLYFATANAKGDYTISCDEKYHTEYEIVFDCNVNSSNVSTPRDVTLKTGETYNFFVNAGANLTKGSTQFTITYDGNGNITVK